MAADHTAPPFTEAELHTVSDKLVQWAQTLPAREQHCLAALLAATTVGDDGDVAGHAGGPVAYQTTLQDYSRQFAVFSRVLANSHEMKKALIGNFPR
jgi:hypothetical protein